MFTFFLNHTLKPKCQPGRWKVTTFWALHFSTVLNVQPRLVSLKSSLSFWFLGGVTLNRKRLTQQFSLQPLWTSLTLFGRWSNTVHSVKQLIWEKSQTISEVVIGALFILWTQNCRTLQILIFSGGELSLLLTSALRRQPICLDWGLLLLFFCGWVVFRLISGVFITDLTDVSGAGSWCLL